MRYQRGKTEKCCRRGNASSQKMSQGQENHSTTTISQRAPANASASHGEVQSLNNEGSWRDVAARPIIVAGKRAVKIVMSAVNELSDLIAEEKEHFPRAVRLLTALKRASAKVTIEVATIALSYPETAFFIAVVAVSVFYALPHVTEMK